MKKIAAALGFASVLSTACIIFPTVAQVPQFPQTLPANTVVGRSGISAGPAQAIPLNQIFGFQGGIATGQPLVSNGGTLAPSFEPIDDLTAMPGVPASKWSPLYFGNSGTGLVQRMNRLFVGEATSASSDIGPVTTKDWVESLVTNATGAAQFISVDTTGQLGLVGASRSGDFRIAFSQATGGAQGITGIGYNNDTGSGAPIAVGGVGIGIRASGVTGITLGYQADMNNLGSVVDIEPATGVLSNITIANLATGGAVTGPGQGTANISALYVAGQGRPGGPVARKGYVSINGALDTTIGAGGGGIAAEFFRGQSIRWRNATPTTDSEMWANASGLTVATPVISGVNGSAGGSFTAEGATSGSWTASASATGVPTMSTPWPVAAGGTGDTGTAWLPGTPNFTCGTATFSSTGSQSKTLGKTTWISGTFTISTIGTCTNSVSMTLPNTPAFNGILPSFNLTTNVVGACTIIGSSTTSNCIPQTPATFAAGNVIAFSGVYQNQ